MFSDVASIFVLEVILKFFKSVLTDFLTCSLQEGTNKTFFLTHVKS